MTGVIQRGVGRCGDRLLASSWEEHRRKLRFLLVGGLCFALQLSVLQAMTGVGLSPPLANGIGFALSAQLNFLLSSAFTWSDRPRATARGRRLSSRALNLNGGRWVSYNGTAAVALVVNTAVFTVAHLVVGPLPAALAGVAAGTVVTYLICDRLVFAPRPGLPGPLLQENVR